MMNPMALLKIKGLVDKFKTNHPRIPMFIGAAGRAIDEGTIIEVTITTSTGQNLCTNMRVTKDDLDLANELGELMKNAN